MGPKRIPLHHVHENLGGKIVSFAGFDMPVRYTSDNEEHLTVREGVGVFDVSHMGEFMIRGSHALDLIQWISSNDASKLVNGQAQYSCMPNDKIKSQNKWDVEMDDVSDDLVLLAVQGPKAVETLQKLTEVNMSGIEFYHFKAGMLGETEMIISATGYTGSGGFELYVNKEDAEDIWNKIFEAGAEFGIKPIGLGARDTLRLEKGFCLYGNDITDETSPLEAGLGWVTKFTKDFVNSESLKAQKEAGVSRKLVGFEMIDRGIPRQGYELADLDGNIIGEVTSGTMSPSLSKGIGLGYVKVEYGKPETEINVIIRGKNLKARVLRPPFLK
jgi:aminomethyltransferase